MKHYKIFIFIVSLVSLMACEDVLDKRDLNVVGDNIWDNETTANMYLTNLYEDNMMEFSMSENSPMSDETYSSSTSYTKFMYGNVDGSTTSPVTVMHKDKYSLIRRINFCLEGLEGSSLSDSAQGLIAGQALFLRAYRHWEMVQLYGGIPMLNTVLDPYYDDLDIARSKTSESIDMIVADLDEAIASLPVEWTQTEDLGRITSGAAAAFKGRILLSWASPMFNPENKAERWQRAYKANQEAIDLLSQMSTPRDLYPEFEDIFTVAAESNPEAVIFRTYNVSAGTDYTHGWEGTIRPPSAGGSGSSNPTWELVKAFPMANGKLINEEGSGYDSAHFWLNRDPRFYKTIVYNGATWELTGRDETKQWCHKYNSFENNRKPGTGFYCRKASDPTIAYASTGETGTDWLELRYAEVLLNFAECANEIGNSSEALEQVRRVRERAGIESGDGTYGIEGSVSLEHLRELIMIERQVEFAFENKRYWDLRRRLMFREDLGEYVKKLNGTRRHGFDIEGKGDYGKLITDRESEYYRWRAIDTAILLGYVNIDSADFDTYFEYNFKEMESTSGGEAQQLDYKELYDYFAIPSAIIQTSPLVIQTIGWLDGTFDPLEE